MCLARPHYHCHTAIVHAAGNVNREPPLYCISGLVGEVAVPCLSSAHSSSTCCQCIPWPPLNARPRVPPVASTTVLSCLCVLLLSCLSCLSCPASRRRQEGLNSLATSPPACLHAQPPCYLPPAAHSHPHSLLSCPAAAVTVPSDSQRVTELLRAHNNCTRPLDKSPLRPVTSTPALSSTTLKTVQSPSARDAQRH